jgi:hypothetical protein
MKPALIIGNGPSVDAIDPALFDHVVSYGSNHIYKKFPEWGREVANVVITDSNRIHEIGDAYRNFHGNLYVGDERYVWPPVGKIRRVLQRDFIPLRQLKKKTLSRFRGIDRLRWHKLLYSVVFPKTQFTFNFEQGLNFGYSVVTSAIQIAVIQGHQTILLTGVETNYNHPKDYFSGAEASIAYVNKTFTDNPRLFMEPVLVAAQIHLEPMGVQLVDCTPRGHLRFIKKGRFLAAAPYFMVDGGC